jgi:hypothetical protein
MGAVGAADPRGVAGWTTSQDRHARGDERHSLFAAHRLPVALSAPRQLSAALNGLHAKVVSHGRYVTFQLAEVSVSRQMFAEILSLIGRLRASPAPA